MIIIELDILGTDFAGQVDHLGTFKMEVPDDFFGEQWIAQTRASYTGVAVHIGRGMLTIRPTSRPKNKPVIEPTE